MKLYGTTLSQRFATSMSELLGPYGQLYEQHDQAPEARKVGQRLLYERSLTIAGGTSEIQKNIIAERILGHGLLGAECGQRHVQHADPCGAA